MADDDVSCVNAGLAVNHLQAIEGSDDEVYEETVETATSEVAEDPRAVCHKCQRVFKRVCNLKKHTQICDGSKGRRKFPSSIGSNKTSRAQSCKFTI